MRRPFRFKASSVYRAYVSPDGKWLAALGNAVGSRLVELRRLPDGAGQRTVKWVSPALSYWSVSR